MAPSSLAWVVLYHIPPFTSWYCLVGASWCAGLRGEACKIGIKSQPWFRQDSAASAVGGGTPLSLSQRVNFFWQVVGSCKHHDSQHMGVGAGVPVKSASIM
jgi:hypothetical protein